MHFWVPSWQPSPARWLRNTNDYGLDFPLILDRLQIESDSIQNRRHQQLLPLKYQSQLHEQIFRPNWLCYMEFRPFARVTIWSFAMWGIPTTWRRENLGWWQEIGGDERRGAEQNGRDNWRGGAGDLNAKRWKCCRERTQVVATICAILQEQNEWQRSGGDKQRGGAKWFGAKPCKTVLL